MNLKKSAQNFYAETRRKIRCRKMHNVHERAGRKFDVGAIIEANASEDQKKSIDSLIEATKLGLKTWPAINLSSAEQIYERQKPLHYLKLQLQLLEYISGHTVVEIGSSRSPMAHDINEFDPLCCNDGHSTYHWASSGKYEVHTVDICADSKALLDAAALPNLKAHTCDGVGFLKDWKGRPIDFLFLDAWDVGVPEYSEKHLEAYLAVKDKMAGKHIIGIDDTDFAGEGKGKYLVPHLLELGYRKLAEGRQTIFINFGVV